MVILEIQIVTLRNIQIFCFCFDLMHGLMFIAWKILPGIFPLLNWFVFFLFFYERVESSFVLVWKVTTWALHYWLFEVIQSFIVRSLFVYFLIIVKYWMKHVKPVLLSIQNYRSQLLQLPCFCITISNELN